MPETLSYLRMLEAESIHILREVAAEFSRPVMLYSTGKDSACLLRLARKAFHPARLPFPLLHIDTTCQFREMTEFRDRTCAEPGLELIVHVPAEADEQGARDSRTILETKALVDALAAGGFDAAIAGARRNARRPPARLHRHRRSLRTSSDAGGRVPHRSRKPDRERREGAALEREPAVAPTLS